jgi:hypothetical protein
MGAIAGNSKLMRSSSVASARGHSNKAACERLVQHAAATKGALAEPPAI